MGKKFSEKVDAAKWLITLFALAVFLPAGLMAKQSMAVVFILAVFGLFLCTLVTRPSFLIPNKTVIFSFVLLCGYVAFTHYTTVTCTPCADKAFGKVLFFALVIWVASSRLVLMPTLKFSSLCNVLLISIIFSISYLALELVMDAYVYRTVTGRLSDPSVALSRFNRGTSALVILIWPTLFLVFHKGFKLAAVFLLISAFCIATLGDSNSAIASVILALIAAVLTWIYPRFTLTLIIIAVIGFSLFVPFIFLHLLEWFQPVANIIPPSTLDRLEIWHRSAVAVIEQPVLGYGIGVSRYLPIPPELASLYKYFTVPTTHPHNAPIQIWLELGSIGLGIMVLLIWFVCAPMKNLRGEYRVTVVAASAAIIFTGFVSYGFWQETWLSIIGMTVILFKLIEQAIPDVTASANNIP